MNAEVRLELSIVLAMPGNVPLGADPAVVELGKDVLLRRAELFRSARAAGWNRKMVEAAQRMWTSGLLQGFTVLVDDALMDRVSGKVKT